MRGRTKYTPGVPLGPLVMDYRLRMGAERSVWQTRRAVPDPKSANLAAVKTLVIDDDEFVRGTVVRQLKALGIARPLEAQDWSEARVALSRHPGCNLVVSDLDMPGAAGSAFLEELATVRPGMALIIVSATEPLVLQAAEKQARRLALRVLGSIAKPTSVDALRALMATWQP